MSETNFTEQDRRWLERLEVPTGPSNSRTKEAITHAIAEIDSLRLENEGLKNSLFVAKMQTRTRSDEAWHRKTESLQAENDSLRAQLGEAQKRAEFEESRIVAICDLIGAEDLELAADKVAKMRSENERLREALRLIQWGGERSFPFCPKCRRFDRDGHAPDCEVGAALAGETKGPCSVCGRPTGGCCTVRKPDPREITRGQQPDPEQPEWATDAVTTRLRAMTPAALRAYVEMFNNLTPAEARAALKRAKAQSETGGAA